MKKLLALLLAMVMIFTLAACGIGNTEEPKQDDPVTSQEKTQGETEKQETESPASGEEQNEETVPAEQEVPTTGTPLDWPDNDYTKLVPIPDCGGKVLAANEIGTLFGIELEWTMEQGLVYAQQLQDAGFGDDCVEKYKQHGYIDRTYNGVNVQLLDLFGTTSISIMPVE